jgi:hypothetical protein
MQVLPTIRGAQLEGYLDGTTAAPPKEINVKTGDTVTVVWTSLGPLPRWVPGPTTRWAPGTTRFALNGT